MTIAVIYGGTRQNGNTEMLTEHVVHKIASEKNSLKRLQYPTYY